MKILIVEDNPMCNLLMEKILSEVGECHSFDNGMEALIAYQKSLEQEMPYALMCLDIRMPSVDGQEVLERVRKIENEKGISKEDRTRIIMVSALDANEIVDKAYKSGCDGFIFKPVKKEDILKAIKKLDLT